MVARTSAAPPTPWSKHLAEPRIDETAYVHSFSNLRYWIMILIFIVFKFVQLCHF